LGDVHGRVSLPLLVVLLLASVRLGEAQVPPERQEQRPIIIKDIAVQGNRRVQEAVILGRITAKVGTPFVPTRLAEDIRSIFALGFFDDVQLKVEDFEGGVKLIFVVAERPFVRDVVFSGNKKYDAAALEEKIDIKLGSVYNPVDINRAQEKLKEFYEQEGYFEVEIAPDVKKLADGDVSILFRITEGRKIRIDRVVIEGAHGVTPREIKDVMATRECEFIPIMIPGCQYIVPGAVQRQKLDEDVDRIVQLYNDHGYIQARVESSDIQVDRIKARATIRIVVVEGPQFHIGAVTIIGNSVLPVEEIRRQILLKPGDVFSRAALRDSVKRVTDLYGSIGRAAAEINPLIQQDLPNLKMNLQFEITEGPEVFVERINIAGNTRSEEKILRREIPMAEGDLFTTQKLARAKQKLTNLNYFETVNTSTSPGATKDRIIVNIDVTEKPTGIFSIGGGYSSSEGIIGTLNLSQRNFLGRGWIVSLQLAGGSKLQNGTISFTEPWLFDTPLTAGFDLYNRRYVYTDYTTNSLGGDIRFGHPIGEFSRWTAIYRVSQDTISDVAPNASVNLLDQEGKHLTSLIGLGVTRDTRDNNFAPTRGSNSSLGFDFAGVGFGEQWLRMLGSTSYFIPIWRDHVLGARVLGGYSVGWGSQPVPLFERFFLGGPNTIRSFKAQQVSPVDSSGTAIGGNIELLGNVEYTVPLFFGIRAAAFIDVGNVWGPDIAGGQKFDITVMHYAVGAGLRWLSPFGPIRIDYGINLNPNTKPPAKQDFGNFQFSVGSAF
jgi:outer membrane protein insertion porin family